MIILNTSLSITSPVQGLDVRCCAMARPTPFSSFLGTPDKLKDDSKSINGQINVKWSVSISSVHFHGKFALKFKMREFYESL